MCYHPNQYGSVDWVLFHRAKGCQFDFQWGHVPGLWVLCLVGVHIKGNQWM